MYVFRSNVAHGIINNLDISEAKKSKGVIDIFTGEKSKKRWNQRYAN